MVFFTIHFCNVLLNSLDERRTLLNKREKNIRFIIGTDNNQHDDHFQIHLEIPRRIHTQSTSLSFICLRFTLLFSLTKSRLPFYVNLNLPLVPLVFCHWLNTTDKYIQLSFGLKSNIDFILIPNKWTVSSGGFYDFDVHAAFGSAFRETGNDLSISVICSCECTDKTAFIFHINRFEPCFKFICFYRLLHFFCCLILLITTEVL